MDMAKEFFVFGLQKSGTKYFKKLIEENTDLKFFQDYAWKHDIDILLNFGLQNLLTIG
jgi:hypothetical protein